MSFRFSGDDVTDQLHDCDVINPQYDYLPPALITLIISNEGGLTPLNLYSVIECSTAGRTSSSISIRKLKISSMFSAPYSSDGCASFPRPSEVWEKKCFHWQKDLYIELICRVNVESIEEQTFPMLILALSNQLPKFNNQ